ncbi:MAG: ribosome biogenesis GTPase Der [Candidatus Zixiibacteriota bacterium]
MALPLVSIVGRPNVGKSTLFNRILRRRQAVVDPTPGVTRDRHQAVAEWTGRSFVLIDTGGLIHQSEETMQRFITEQAGLAIEQSDLIILLVDGSTGVHPEDAIIADQIRKSGKPFILAVNKIDDPANEAAELEFAELGLGDTHPISALLGLQVGDLLDKIVANMPSVEPLVEDGLRLAVVGRPNVGKSSLVNRLLGEPRMIVSEIPGTTRDSIDTHLEFEGQKYTLIDTAGLRKPKRVRDQIEFYTALRTSRAISRSEVVCVLLDASADLSNQDFKIAEAAVEAGAGLMFAVNKWDLIEKDTHTAGRYVHDLQARAATFSWAPIVFISAFTGQRTSKVLTMAQEIAAMRRKHISTRELTATILDDIQRKPPPAVKGRFIKINYATQSEKPPPTFVFFCNHPDLIGETYVRFITNRIRERFDFSGVPVRVQFRKKGK